MTMVIVSGIKFGGGGWLGAGPLLFMTVSKHT